jgi:hypothetical protein
VVVVLQSIELLLHGVALLRIPRTSVRGPIGTVHDPCVALLWVHTMAVQVQRLFVLHHRVAFVRSRDLNFDSDVDGPTLAFDDLLPLADGAVLARLLPVVVDPCACSRG